MLHKLTTIYDSKSETYMRLHPVKTQGEALRFFTSECNNPQSQLNKWPEDFSLWIVADYDDATGIITPLDKHICLGKAIEYVEESPQMPLINKSEIDKPRELTQ